MEDDGEDFGRIPLSNEIVLRGHTKVTARTNCFLCHIELVYLWNLHS
jgi:hypothetical protein